MSNSPIINHTPNLTVTMKAWFEMIDENQRLKGEVEALKGALEALVNYPNTSECDKAEIILWYNARAALESIKTKESK